MTPTPTVSPREAEQHLHRVDRAAYYAHRHYLSSRHPDALTAYQAALRECARAVEALKQAEKAQEA